MMCIISMNIAVLMRLVRCTCTALLKMNKEKVYKNIYIYLYIKTRLEVKLHATFIVHLNATTKQVVDMWGIYRIPPPPATSPIPAVNTNMCATFSDVIPSFKPTYLTRIDIPRVTYCAAQM